MAHEAVLEITGLRKDHHGLRPLRIERLELRAGEIVALGGVDATAAEVLVNLLTGATLPDEGEVRMLGRSTADVSDADEWLQWLDKVGLVSDRAAVLGHLTVAQNLAMSFTLDIDPIPPGDMKNVAAVAKEVGLESALLPQRVEGLSPEAVARIRLARALALAPKLVLLEHATASLPANVVPAFMDTVRQSVKSRDLAALAVSADPAVRRAAHRAFELQPATGALKRTWRWPWPV